MAAKPKIGLVGMGHFIYWPQFDGLKQELMQKTERFKKYFSDEVEIFDGGFADDYDTAVQALKRCKAQDLDALFIVMTTYITSQTVFPFAKYLGDVPQFLIALQPLDRLDYSKTTTYMQLVNDDICSMPEFAGVYERLGAHMPYFLVCAESQEQTIKRRVELYEKAICAKAAFKYAKFGYLGHTYDGMYDMNTDPTAFSRTFGAHVKMLEMCELKEYCDGASDAEIKARIDEIKTKFQIMEPSNDPLTDYVHDEDLELAARTSVALDKLVQNNGLSALAYFYKGEHGNEYEKIASNLIIGNTLLTSRGIPLAGEADLKTAAAMLIMNKVGGGGSFAELHPFDIYDDVVLIGHDGPHNINISSKKPVLRKLKKFHGKPGSGVSVEFSIKNGPVTLLSCSLDRNEQFKFICTKGESMPGEIPQTGNTNTKCKFENHSCTEFVENWCKAGPTHHLALGTGDKTEEIKLAADLIGVNFTNPLA